MIEPDIIAKVTLYRVADGGRKSPTPDDHFACPIVLEGKYHDCRLLLTECGPLSPGDSNCVPIKFLAPDLVLPALSVGKSFDLWELRIIGSGQILEIVSEGGNTQRWGHKDGRWGQYTFWGYHGAPSNVRW